VVASIPPGLGEAYDACARLARRHYENFPVAWLVPSSMRPHVAAVYAFARTADDVADEGQLPASERLRVLAEWRTRLLACAEGRPDPDGPPHDLIFRALGHSIRALDLPVALLDDLLSAFEQDVTVHRYTTWAELLDYCRRSANPVGRLVLRIAGHRDDDLDRASDDVCTALQLTNFWQDFARDWAAGRLYLPRDEYVPLGAREDDLGRDLLTSEWRAAIGRAVAITRELFADGRSVCDGVSGRLRLELRLTWLGGMTILDRLSASGFDPYRFRPTISRRDLPGLLWRAIVWTPLA